MQQVIRDLRRLRRSTVSMLLAQRAALGLALILAVALVLVLLDWGLRLPRGLRLAILLGGGGAVAWALFMELRLAVRFRPTLTQLALRVERTTPQIAGRLASSVEFAASGVDESNPLAARSVKDTETRLSGHSMRTALRPSRTLRDVAIFAAIVAVIVAGAFANPTVASTGVKRLLLPYSAIDWPARTGVRSLMEEVLDGAEVHPRGQALALRAEVTRGDDDQRVDAHYRIRVDGAFGSWERLVLTHQGDGVHERLVDTDGEEIDLYFETDDAETARQRVKLVAPPAVDVSVLVVTPPAYASGRFPSYETSLGPGIDERAITDTASLVGSRVELVLDLNKPMPMPVPGDRGTLDEWIRTTFGWIGDVLPEFDAPESDRWRLRWQLAETVRLSLALEDEYGLGNIEPITFRIDSTEDRPPAIIISEPQTDEAVLATALVPLAAEAQDDVAIARVGLEADIDRAANRDAAAAAADAPRDDASPPVWEAAEDVDAVTTRFSDAIDLAGFDLTEGDVVLITATAQDIYELGGVRHDPVRSLPRRLRVLSELDFASQLRRQLGAVRQNAIRIEAMQSELQDDVIDKGVLPGMNTAQGQVAERIAQQRATADLIEHQLRRNRLDDPSLSELLQQTADHLDQAGRSATRAVEAIEQREDSSRASARDGGEAAADGTDAGGEEDAERPFGGREPDEADRPIVDDQQEVRDELASLIELLDRDEDTWVVTRRLEGLREDQTRLQTRTEQLGEQTIGLSRDDLTEEQLSELDRIAQRQEELTDQGRQIVEELRQRAEALEEADPQSAAGMRAAADTAERRELDRDMATAARRAEQNQMRGATTAQQSAAETLARMLEDIEETKRARAEELLRRLASLVESIDRLITVQKSEIQSLAVSLGTGDYTGRDRAMIRLSQNTLAVAGEARAAGMPARRIARTLDRASDAQGASVSALRARPVEGERADEAEQRALELLEEARKLTEELQQQTEEQETRRRREELIEAYRGFVEQQKTIRDGVVELGAEGELDRRGLVQARRLSQDQENLRTGLAELRDMTREVMESPVFSHAHRLIDNWSRLVTERLEQGEATSDVTDRQQLIIDGIGELITAMEESTAPPEEFEQNQQGGGSGASGQQPLIPPVAELKLLRGLQRQVYNQTRDVDQRSDLDTARERETLRDLGQQQRDLQHLGEEILDRLKQGSMPTPAPVPSPAPPGPDDKE